MVSLNPFKKSEDKEFKLDKEPIPSVNDINNSSQGNPPQQQPQNNGQPNNVDVPQFQPPAESNSTGDNSANQENQNIQHDIYKAKLDSIDSKISLLESKISSQEETLKQIHKILMEEISDETKQRLHLNSMVDDAKEKDQNQ